MTVRVFAEDLPGAKEAVDSFRHLRGVVATSPAEGCNALASLDYNRIGEAANARTLAFFLYIYLFTFVSFVG